MARSLLHPISASSCRDVGEDAAQRNRIYVPLDELEQFGIAEEEVRRYAGTGLC